VLRPRIRKARLAWLVFATFSAGCSPSTAPTESHPEAEEEEECAPGSNCMCATGMPGTKVCDVKTHALVECNCKGPSQPAATSGAGASMVVPSGAGSVAVAGISGGVSVVAGTSAAAGSLAIAGAPAAGTAGLAAGSGTAGTGSAGISGAAGSAGALAAGSGGAAGQSGAAGRAGAAGRRGRP
jgi:hypothetical protein